MKRTEKRFVSRHTKKKYVSSLEHKMRKFTGFMIARHPMDRLFSAFRDKILRKSILVKNINGKSSAKPTFSRFLTYLAMSSPTSYDRHWKPNWVLCNPCMYKYDYILKMESLDRDSAGLLNQIGSSDVAEINHLNVRGVHKKKEVNYEALLKQVKPHILEKILNIYHLDFVMFGYDLSPFTDILARKYKEMSPANITVVKNVTAS